MRTARFFISFIKTFLKRFNVILIVGILIGVVGFFGIKAILGKIVPSNIQYIGVVGRYHTDELPPSMLQMIGDGLTKLDEKGIPVSSLAKSWKVGDGGKTWEFDLDTGKKWQDGTAVTSDSIQYSFDDVTIDRPNDHTIVFHLNSAYAPFPVVVAHPTFKKGLLGTGEWRVDNISLVNTYVEKIILKNNLGQEKLYRFYPNEEAADTAFKLGQVDILEEISDPTAFKDWNTAIVTSKKDSLRYVGIFYNNLTGVFRDNKPLRQALAYAIPKDQWEGYRALSPIPEESWSYNPQVKPYDYDPKHAEELLNTVVKKGQTLHIKLSTVPDLLPVADDIAKDWEKVGIATEVQVVNEIPRDFEALLVEYDVSLDPDQYLTWHSTQTDTNVSHYVNARIDKLLEDGRLELDPEKRKKIYLDFQRFLLEDVPAAFLYHPISYTVTRK